MADVHVRAEKPDDSLASLAVRSSKLLLGAGLALSAIAHLTLGGVVLFASPRLFATVPENSMMVDIVTPQELADAQQAVENVAEPTKPEQTATVPAVATPPQQASLPRQSDQRPQQAASPRPQPPLDPQQPPLQRQSDVPPKSAPPQTAASAEQALPDPTQVAALLNLSMKVANPDLDGPPTDSAANLSADEIEAFKQHVRTCWVAPTAGIGARPTAVVRVSLGPNGRLRAEPDLVSISNASSADGLALVASAKRALTRCQPYSVFPAGKYQEWKLLDLNFSTDGIADVGSPQRSGKGG
jgi:hypothetical protein